MSIFSQSKLEHSYVGDIDENKDFRIIQVYDAMGMHLVSQSYDDEHNVRTLYFKKA